MAVMEELVSTAVHELHLLAYVVTPSARALITLIEGALGRGVKLTMVVNVIPHQPVALAPELLGLAARFPHANVRFFSDASGEQLHAKVLVADRGRAVIGSANFTWSGMTTNHEIGVLLEGPAAWDLALLVDRIAASPSALPTPSGGRAL